MSWISPVWSMIAAACLTLAFIHLSIWARESTRLSHLLFAILALAVAGLAAAEMLMMRAETIEEFGSAQRWLQVPAFVVVVSTVWFVRTFLGAGRLWLAYTVCALRLLSLIFNFSTGVNLSYSEITGLRQLELWGGEHVSAAYGVFNPWQRVAQLSLLLLVAYVMDAAFTAWRRGDRDKRRRAASVGGSIAFFLLMAGTHYGLVLEHVIPPPYVGAPAFLAMLVAMGYELGSDVFRAGRLDGQLRISNAHLQESERRFGAMADAAPVMIWMAGTDRLCTFFNRGWLAFTGRSIDQELGNGWTGGVHPADLDHCIRMYSDAFNAHRDFSMEYRLRRHDGEYRWVLDSGVPRVEADGTFLGYVGSAVDVTDLRKTEAEAAQQRNELAHLSRVAMLGELSGSLAHELNQPLAAILSNAQAAQRILGRGAGNIDEILEILKDIVADDKRAGEVIKRLRTLFRKEEVRYRALEVNDVALDVLKMMRSDLLNRDVAVRTELAAGLPQVDGDPVQLQQVLLNLVMNGCDAMDGVPGERRLTLRTAAAAGGEIEVSVADRGRGIPPADLQRIFDPFVSTKTEGLGLGLAVCRTIVAAHAGRLWAANNRDGGASFHFTLPAKRDSDERTGADRLSG